MRNKIPSPERSAVFIESMECLPVPNVPEGPEWTYEIKLDGYRLEAVRSVGRTILCSRRGNVLNKRFGFIAEALNYLPDGTVIDGELVALGPDGRPNFNLLQNFGSAESQISYFVFDILVYKSRDLTRMPLSERRKILRSVIRPSEHIGISEVSERTAKEMLRLFENTAWKAWLPSEKTVSISPDFVQDCGRSTGSIWVKSLSSAVTFRAISDLIPSSLVFIVAKI